METVVFVTGNHYKFQVAQESLKDTGIELIQKKLETPEIQSTSVEEVATYSAVWASQKLQLPVIVTDVGYYIKALNGFPGPFVKWVNQWFSAQDYLNLLKDSADRTIEVHEAIAFCRPHEAPQVFTDIIPATIAHQAGKAGYSPIDSIYIPQGYDKTAGDIPQEEMVRYWAKNSTKWQQFINFYQNNFATKVK